jgi:hypothetical protein
MELTRRNALAGFLASIAMSASVLIAAPHVVRNSGLSSPIRDRNRPRTPKT